MSLCVVHLTAAPVICPHPQDRTMAHPVSCCPGAAENIRTERPTHLDVCSTGQRDGKMSIISWRKLAGEVTPMFSTTHPHKTHNL